MEIPGFAVSILKGLDVVARPTKSCEPVCSIAGMAGGKVASCPSDMAIPS